MEKNDHRTPEQETEREKYQQDLSLLESTEGFRLLTPKQQQVIRVSLHLQGRAERAMHPHHKNDPYYYDWNAEKIRPYEPSLKHINDWYCHKAVDGLENESLSVMQPVECAKEFFDGGYFPVDNPLILKKRLEAFGFPCVVHIGGEEGNRSGEDGRVHSFLALGHDIDGHIVVWEKVNMREPYRVTRLEQVYGDRGPGYFWGIRKLR